MQQFLVSALNVLESGFYFKALAETSDFDCSFRTDVSTLLLRLSAVYMNHLQSFLRMDEAWIG